ncbi:MAG: TerB family tellurite resistance protein [Proteobacteria bacterium]|nr:TerB family tellurite resistance protein [Pseudomonadota bacterium]
MNDSPITPLFGLAVAIAYVIQSDGKTSVQERAEWLTLFGQLVESGKFSKAHLATMTKTAFAHAAATDLSEFLEQLTPVLSYSQKISVLINLYDTMLADGNIKEGGHRVFEQFHRAFEIDKQTLRTIREFLSLKNDITLFTDANHPYNDDDFSLASLFREN